ncbi:MAG: ATP-binding protein, partial [Chloroflexota bacterium]
DAEGEAVFRMFFRSVGQGMRAPGTGIGLFVSRAVVEAMGGRIWTRPTDGGAEVAFSLPIYHLDD